MFRTRLRFPSHWVRAILLMSALGAFGCGASIKPSDASSDAASPDGISTDGASGDAARSDAGPIDAEPPRDAGTPDALDAGDDSGPGRRLLEPGLVINHRPFRTDYNVLTPWIEGIAYLRGWGGSRGMATYPTEASVPDVLREGAGRYSVVAQAEIDGMLGVQGAHGVRIVYVVNVNDTIESQAAFIQRLLDEGLDLAMLELGNELYLGKFESGNLDGLGVARVWTAEMYRDEMPAWAEALQAFGLPLYVVGCSFGPDGTRLDLRRQAWNEPVATLVANHPELIDGVTFHHYSGPLRGSGTEEDIQPADFGYLSYYGDLPIAITESGYAVAENSPENLEAAALFWTRFRAALKPADSFGMHVLQASDGPSFDSYRLYDEIARTPLGDRLERWLADGE